MTSNLNTKSTTSAADTKYRFATTDDLDSLVHEFSRKIVGGMMSINDVVTKYHNQVLFEDDGVKVMIDGEQLQRSLERAVEDIQPVVEIEEEPINTDEIFNAYLSWCSYKGFDNNRVTDERLEQMLTELAALCEEHCVDALDVVTGKKLIGTQLQAIRDCDVMRKSDAVVTLDEVGL